MSKRLTAIMSKSEHPEDDLNLAARMTAMEEERNALVLTTMALARALDDGARRGLTADLHDAARAMIRKQEPSGATLLRTLAAALTDERAADQKRAASERRPLSSLERVVNRVFDAVDEADQRKLLARFRKLQAVGLPTGLKPSKGQKSGYTELQICEVVLCLSFSDFGLEPRHIAEMMDNAPRIAEDHPYFSAFFDEDSVENAKQHPVFTVELFYVMMQVADGRPSSDDFILIFFPKVISKGWSNADPFVYRTGRLIDMIGIVDDKPSRFAVLNLSELGLRIREALDETPD